MKEKLLVVALLALVGVLAMGGQRWDAQAQDQGASSTEGLATDSLREVPPGASWAAGSQLAPTAESLRYLRLSGSQAASSQLAPVADGPRYALPTESWAAGSQLARAADRAHYALPSESWTAGSRAASAADPERYDLPNRSWAAGVAAREAAGSDPLAMVRRSTASYHRIEMAEEEGFVPLFNCIASLSDTSQGAMGTHYILPSRFDDQLELDEPEVLIYEPQTDGRMRLVAVEYVIPSAAWPEDADPPEFLGQELKYKTTMGKYGKEDGIEPYYEVHVWVWKYNPSGVFADWNPTVSCSS